MEPHLIYLAAVLGLGVAAQWLAWRARLPAILVLLVLGFAMGQFAFGYAAETFGSSVDELLGRELLFSAVSLSVAVILFEGGLSLRISEVRETGRAVLGLVTVGVMVTWALSWAAARWILGFDNATAALAGAILVVSGPTVIVPLLRHVRPVRRVGSLVKWEGIVNDPIGAVLAVLVFEATLAVGPREAVADVLGAIVATVAVGCGIALAAAIVLVLLLRRFLVPDYLQSAVFLATVVVAFTASNSVQHESGLVAVTLLGVILANQKAVTIKHVVEFKENLRVLLISVLFVVLASRLQFDDLSALGWRGLALLGVLVLVVRPAAVFLSTVRTGLAWRERLFLSWIAPRGIVAAAVASVFALHVENAERLVPLVFLVIVGTVTIYGLTAAPLARWLKIADPNPQGILFAGASEFVRAMATAVQEAGYSVMLIDTNSRNIAAARMAGLPTCWANVLSGYVREELDFGGIGRFAAMTPNDVVNALAAEEFIELFGRANVSQFAPKTPEAERREPVSSERLGRLLFDGQIGHAELSARVAAGAVVKTTSLTDDFDYDAFRELYGPSAIILAVIEPSGELTLSTADQPIAPKSGQTVMALVDSTE